MKKTRFVAVVISIVLLFVMVLNLLGCATVKAENLMKDIEQQKVEGKSADEAFVNSQMVFAVKLFQSCFSEDENILISPLSVQLALAMTANGADGETKAELQSLLGGEITVEELNEYLYAYVNSLPSEEKYKLQIANSIWFRDDEERLTVNGYFLQTNANYYGAEAYKSAFDGQTVKDINNWVDKNTDGMIEKVIDEIDTDEIMYLINALVFDAEWQTVYESTDIYDGKFTTASGEKQSVEMMSSTENKYILLKNAKGFSKKYKGGKYSFVALLPNEDITLGEFVESLNAEELTTALEIAVSASVQATVPKFSYEYGIEMSDSLKELGVTSAFNSQDADFSKLGESENGNIFVGSVLHKTYISVDERGTKAGAVTKVDMTDGASFDTGYIVRLDRPFFYMIVETETNLPIFMGTVTSVK